MDDLTAQVSQQATLMLGTIHDAALKSVMSCLEYQFDTGEFLKVSLFRNVFFIIFNPPKKNELKNLTLQLWYLKSNCFPSFFGRIEDTKKTFRN